MYIPGNRFDLYDMVAQKYVIRRVIGWKGMVDSD